MKLMFNFIIAFVLIILCSCDRDYTRKEYMEWVRDQKNGLHIIHTSGDYYFDVQYKPTDYVVFEQLEFYPDNTDSLKKELEGLQYYQLTIGKIGDTEDFILHNVADETEKQFKLYYFSYLFQQDIYLKEDGQKLPCLLFHFERSYDLKKSRSFSLGFEKRFADSQEASIIIESEWLTEKPIEIKISKKIIPTVKL